ncbi:MAG: hypothetical protein ACOCQX_04255 [Candidatus Nanoarchaeia archaeon]
MVILFDQYNLPNDVYEIIFATKQQRIVARQLIKEIKNKGGEITKTDMSVFATALHEGNYVAELDEPEYKGKTVKLAYNKRQFYDRILTPMKGMGLIDYDLYRKVYKLSDKFNKYMYKIGLMWVREIKSPA